MCFLAAFFCRLRCLHLLPRKSFGFGISRLKVLSVLALFLFSFAFLKVEGLGGSGERALQLGGRYLGRRIWSVSLSVLGCVFFQLPCFPSRCFPRAIPPFPLFSFFLSIWGWPCSSFFPSSLHAVNVAARPVALRISLFCPFLSVWASLLLLLLLQLLVSVLFFFVFLSLSLSLSLSLLLLLQGDQLEGQRSARKGLWKEGEEA